MTNLPIYDKTGAQVGSYELDLDAMAPKVSKQLLHDAVVMYQANLRQGSAKTKTRSEVSGSRKKMYRQKGTGNARAGHKRSGVRRGGGHIFAKTPKDWSYRLPRKALKLATRMAMAEKVRAEFVKVIDVLQVEAPKTKVVADVLGKLAIEKTVLVVVDKYDANMYLSVRNIPTAKILPVSDLNAYEILRPKQLLVTKSAMDAFVKTRVEA
ncbi:MAG: 50S ribosomal protein L4 [Thermoguttaceae bacterium]|jgi:large subunit ribosomal protein L4|nr:50S ribosomal protein L4 [Thermoguttaceae bacterium]MBQ5789596.1 50S ribosomal protein L4 [Thermoguttaceae bacterium]MBR4976724.1 50S ribosomal protein L4 [Thermoguttaceae bacterium]